MGAPSPTAAAALSRRCDAKDLEVELGDSDEALLEYRLQRAILAAKSGLQHDGARWPRRHGALCVPRRYFQPFGQEVLGILYDFFADRVEEQLAEKRQRLKDNCSAFLREVDAYRDRLQPQSAKTPSHRTFVTSPPEEELYLYEPLQYWDEDQQQEMRKIIDARYKLLLADPSFKARMRSATSRRRPGDATESDEDGDGFAAESAAAERAAHQRRERAKLEHTQNRENRRNAVVPGQNAVEAGLASSAEYFELLRQLEVLRKNTEVTEVRCTKLREERDRLQHQVDMLLKHIHNPQERAQVSSPAGARHDSGWAQAHTGSRHEVADGSTDTAGRAQTSASSEQLGGLEARLEHEKERQKLQARIAELQDAIARLKDKLAGATSEANDSESDSTDYQSASAVQSARGAASSLAQKCLQRCGSRFSTLAPLASSAPSWQPSRRAIFERLHQDAAHRVTRLISRCSESSGERHEAALAKVHSAEPGNQRGIFSSSESLSRTTPATLRESTGNTQHFNMAVMQLSSKWHEAPPKEVPSKLPSDVGAATQAGLVAGGGTAAPGATWPQRRQTLPGFTEPEPTSAPAELQPARRARTARTAAGATRSRLPGGELPRRHSHLVLSKASSLPAAAFAATFAA